MLRSPHRRHARADSATISVGNLYAKATRSGGSANLCRPTNVRHTLGADLVPLRRNRLLGSRKALVYKNNSGYGRMKLSQVKRFLLLLRPVANPGSPG